jgi:hypothetical protein
MSRRKPIVKPIAVAMDAVAWRLRIHIEMLEGITLPPQFKEPIKRMQDALEDYEASRNTVNGHAQLELTS